MEWMYLGIVLFLFLLAVFDLWVGVSNDAVNFLNSAIGSRAARFRTLVAIASVGVLLGCMFSNGMMDIARHGIFSPGYFSFREVMFIYLAVMVTDIVLLDTFNTFGLPTSTTVSLVFELLGASFAFVIMKMAGAEGALGAGDYLNTQKALEVIVGIFLSVPLAFMTGTAVQYLARLSFTFGITRSRGLKVSLFCGLAITAILYFMLFKGMKDLSFMSPEVKELIHSRTVLILGSVLAVSVILMQLLQALRVNVFRLVVLCGTFALAMAFAGNDLVNFLGVPLAGFSSYLDFRAHGGGISPDAYAMTSLAGSARTPLVFLAVAGVVMVGALATSRKARRVVETEVGLSRSDDGQEMFGSSRVARSLVRWGNSMTAAIGALMPLGVVRFVDSRFRRPAAADGDGAAAYDLLRASVNLVVAALLVGLGTSLKLPLSTTFVTFMVAMGTSLADRAWSRESAVFRITGVLTVIGGWFLTAGVALTASFLVALLMNFGGAIAAVAFTGAGIYALVRSQRRFARRGREEAPEGDVLFTQMMQATDRSAVLPMLTRHLNVSVAEQLEHHAGLLRTTTEALFGEHLRPLRRDLRLLREGKRTLKNLRRRETVCLRRVEPPVSAIRVSTAFHLIHNALRQLHYGVMRIAEPAYEHVDNHFTPVPAAEAARYRELREEVDLLLADLAGRLRDSGPTDAVTFLARSRKLQERCRRLSDETGVAMQSSDVNLTAAALLLHIVQETEQLLGQTDAIIDNMCRYHELA